MRIEQGQWVNRVHGRAGNRQAGVVLITSLVLLLVLTLLGVSGMQNTMLEERMAGNMRDRGLAFQAAEATLREGEDLLTTAALPVFNGNNGLYQQTRQAPPEIWEDTTKVDWDNGTGVRTFSDSSDAFGIRRNTQWIVEELPPVTGLGGSLEAGVAHDIFLYRVTAESVGKTSNAQVILQSVYRR